ncbi:hypothetical protein C5L14_03895 [Labrys okinawensis]|uniref:Uncharacterized protein n=1 Tax=Labrys okinawensis TaxID=346911 RepID=A0A2S9QGB4_9HYPH|nr:hypothetical protein [Labrys okinawensis]PRH88393.1 hypothetical protein C5L14_03895 [Labrys okinawensis]
MRLLLSIFFTSALFGTVQAQSAPLTEWRLVEMFDARLLRDGLDPIRACRGKDGESHACTFDDTEYLTTIRPGADVTGSIGASRSPTSMTIVLAGNAIDSIGLVGDRASPADLINFTAHLESLLHTIGPEKSDYDIEQDMLDLGVMRGDADGDIGRARVVSESFATIRCLNQRLVASAGIACTITMRPAG